MSKNKADFVTFAITLMLVMLLALCWKLDSGKTMYFIWGLASLGVVQFIQATRNFLMAPEKERRNGGKHE